MTTISANASGPIKDRGSLADGKIKALSPRRKKGSAMLVEMWMTRDPVTLPPDATISFAAMQMGLLRVRHLLVTEGPPAGQTLVGIVSKYDVARAFPTNLNPFSIEVFEDTVPRPLSTIMTRNIYSTSPDTPIEEAARILRSHKIGALPVMRASRLMGIITESDIFNAFIAMTGASHGGVRLTLEMNADESLIPTVIDLSRRYGVRLFSFFSYSLSQPRLKNARTLCTFRFSGGSASAFVEQIWKSGHRVLTALK